jgi:hypothetical protein
MSDLLDQLAAERSRLHDAIEQPALADINARATALRRRRRYLQTAVPVLAALTVLLLAMHPWRTGTGHRPADPKPTATPPVWRGQGITLIGLAGLARDVPGNVFDIEYVGDDHLYALSSDCANGVNDCAVSFLESTDGGQAWSDPLLLTRVPADRLPSLVSTIGDLVVAAPPVTGTLETVVRQAGWMYHAYDYANLPSVPSVPAGQLWLPGPGCPAGRLLTLSAGTGQPAVLLNQPPIDPCWVAPVRADDGGWWVSGSANGRPAVAVTRDGGLSWQESVLPEPVAGGYRVRVATLGHTVYAAVLGPDGSDSIQALYRSTDGGTRFTPSRPGRAITLSGDLVPLPDGRLLFVGTDRNWYLWGKTITPVTGLLPAARVTRTPAGYVAHDLLAGGWAAISVDGVSWHKIGIR